MASGWAIGEITTGAANTGNYATLKNHRTSVSSQSLTVTKAVMDRNFGTKGVGVERHSALLSKHSTPKALGSGPPT